jgi:pyridoxal phosphate enzyme (YggS family)
VSATIDSTVLREGAERFAAVRERIDAACGRAGRDPSEVALIGASKRQSLERIAAAVCAGLDQLGENYVQEARDKREALASLLEAHCGEGAAPRPLWRLIGNLQSNKAGTAAGVFDAVDTVDRLKLAKALSRRALDEHGPMDVLLQVNLSGETTKAGCGEDELPGLLAGCAPLEGVRVVGLMTVPAATPDPEGARAPFARLRELRDTLSREPGGEALRELSMGMSADFEVAIEEGATLIRVGTALFGGRPPAV